MPLNQLEPYSLNTVRKSRFENRSELSAKSSEMKTQGKLSRAPLK